jgi:predicted HTH domain antitoxin
MSLVIPDETLRYAGMSEAELREEIAILLFQKERLTLGQASQLAQISQLQFQRLLADRKIPLHYGVTEFEEDIRTIER